MSDREPQSSEDLIRHARDRIRDFDEPTQPQADSVPPPVQESPREINETVDPTPEPVIYEPGPPEQPIETPQPQQGGGFWTSTVIRIGIGLLIFGGWWLFNNLGDADRGDSGEIVGGGDLDVMTMQPGDCFNDPDGDVVFDVQAVPCSESHDNEVFSIGSVSGVFGENFPGLEALDAYAYDTCIGSPFESYVGIAYLESSLGVFTLTPTQESWDDGDRGYVCSLFSLDFVPLTGTARDSGI